MRVIILLLLLLSAEKLAAQAKNEGRVEIVKSPRIDSLVKKHRTFNEQQRTMQGFRIQLYFGTQRNKANEIKALFQEKFPSYPAYLIYQQPNFKVRVGDFITRIEAFKLYKELESEYESVFIVKDQIKPPKIE
jgi:hypothetical protein